MFFGEFLHKIDQKGRVSIPAKLRPYLIDGLVVTRGFERCLVIYPKKEWEKVLNNLSSLPSNQLETRIFQRMILSGAFDETLDGQGRFLVPEYLRNYANINIESNLMIIGMNNKIEVWEEKSWKDYKENFEKNIDNISQKLPQVGL